LARGSDGSLENRDARFSHSSFDSVANRTERSMLKIAWTLLKETVSSFINDDALSRGASMAFYAFTSLAPILLIVVAIAGIVFGEDAARSALAGQFEALMGQQSAALLQGAIENAGRKSSGILATIGVVTLLVTASGVFGEMQSALNTIWKVVGPRDTSVSRLIRARAVSLGLVAAWGSCCWLRW
jgi:membrane protein